MKSTCVGFFSKCSIWALDPALRLLQSMLASHNASAARKHSANVPDVTKGPNPAVKLAMCTMILCQSPLLGHRACVAPSCQCAIRTNKQALRIACPDPGASNSRRLLAVVSECTVRPSQPAAAQRQRPAQHKQEGGGERGREGSSSSRHRHTTSQHQHQQYQQYHRRRSVVVVGGGGSSPHGSRERERGGVPGLDNHRHMTFGPARACGGPML